MHYYCHVYLFLALVERGLAGSHVAGPVCPDLETRFLKFKTEAPNPKP